MSKYTETLVEFLEGGGSLPAAFAEIVGFEDLFVARYCDKEIGFETEALFQIKQSSRLAPEPFLYYNILILQYSDAAESWH